MAKMYVANLTRQAQDFIYRLPETRKSTFQQIPVGGQVLLSGDLTTKDIEAVIQQHAPYGMVPAAEVAKRREFNGLCFALDRPVPIEALRRGLEANRAVLDARGVELRRQAAIAVNNLTQDADPDVAAMEVEIIEQDSKDGGAEATLSEGIRVDRNAPSGSTEGRPDRRTPAKPRRGKRT